MSGIRMRSPRRFSASAIAFIFSAVAFVAPAMATDSGSLLPDLSGQWGRDMLFFEPPPSGPGPFISAVRKADGLPFFRMLQFDFGDAEQNAGDHLPDRAAQVDLLRDGDNPDTAVAPVGQHIDAFLEVAGQPVEFPHHDGRDLTGEDRRL